MAQSSPSVFVAVEGDYYPIFGATLKDDTGAVVPRPGVDAELVTKPIPTGAADVIPLDWTDAPANTHPEVAALGQTLPVGVYYGNIRTDPTGDPWTFPTEAAAAFQIIIRAKLDA